MSQPERYTRTFSFTDFSGSNPLAQQPGPRVDAELDAVSRTAGEICDNLALIQRDDGALRNGIVTQDSLAVDTDFKGDPGGNVMAIGLFGAAAALLIPLGTDLVQTSGYSTKGIGAALYVADTAVDAAFVSANPRASFISANSRGFRLLDQYGIHVDAFGPTGDGTTDDQAAFEALKTYVNTRTTHAGSGLRGAPVIRGGNKTYYFADDFSFKGFTAIWEGAGHNFSALNSGSDPVGPSTVFKIAAGKTFYFERAETLKLAVDGTLPWGANDSTFRNITFTGGGSVSKPLAYQRCTTHFEHCTFNKSAGVGLWVIATTGGGTSIEGNANSSTYRVCTFGNNTSDGLRIGVNGGVGSADVNALLFEGCFFTSNGGYGFADYSFLGVTFIGGHSAANSAGAYLSNNANACSLYAGIYVEGGQPPAVYGPRCVGIGGLQGAGVSGAFISADEAMPSSSGWRSSSTTGRLTLGGTANAILQGYNTGFGDGTTLYNVRFRGDSVAFGIGVLDPDISVIMNGTSGVYAMGRTAGQAPSVWAFRELAIGDGTYDFDQARIIQTRVAVPTTGNHALGETTLFRDPVAGGRRGAVCTATGTPGTWVEFGDIVLAGSKTFDPPSIAAAGQTSTTVTVTGAALGDYVVVSFSLDLLLVGISGYVSAANTVTVLFKNGTAGAIDLGSGTLRARVFKQ